MAKMTSTGLILAVSAAAPATEDAAGYAALTYTTIGGITGVGAFGAAAAMVESNPLATGITEKYKGFVNYGSITVDSDYDPADAGQAILETAVEDIGTGGAAYDRHSFKVTYQTGDVRYFQGKVFSVPENPGSTNTMVTRSIQVEIETKIIRVAAP